MKDTLTYRGYMARVEFDPRDNVFWGKVLGIRDSISFEGETVEQIITDFHNAVDFYLEDCAKTGRAPQKTGIGQNAAAYFSRGSCRRPGHRAGQRQEPEPVGLRRAGQCGARLKITPLPAMNWRPFHPRCSVKNSDSF